MPRQFPASREPFDDSSDDTPIAQLWYAVLADAIKHNYERIHVYRATSSSPTFTIRALKEGAWEDIMSPPGLMYAAFIQRMKVMATLNMVRRQQHDEGAFQFLHRNAVFDMKVTLQIMVDETQQVVIDLPSGPTVSAPTPTLPPN